MESLHGYCTILLLSGQTGFTPHQDTELLGILTALLAYAYFYLSAISSTRTYCLQVDGVMPRVPIIDEARKTKSFISLLPFTLLLPTTLCNHPSSCSLGPLLLLTTFYFRRPEMLLNLPPSNKPVKPFLLSVYAQFCQSIYQLLEGRPVNNASKRSATWV